MTERTSYPGAGAEVHRLFPDPVRQEMLSSIPRAIRITNANNGNGLVGAGQPGQVGETHPHLTTPDRSADPRRIYPRTTTAR